MIIIIIIEPNLFGLHYECLLPAKKESLLPAKRRVNVMTSW